jgi:ABC-type polysaccharide/polyol phosphate export permease
MLSQAWRAVALYFVALWEFRFFWVSLVKAELLRRYRRSFLGLGWSLLQPLSMTVVLGVVYGRVFHLPFSEFAPMLLCGLAFWNMVSQSILRGCQSLVAADAYIRQQPLPLAMFPLREVLVVGFHFLISLLLTLLLVLPLKGTFGPLALLSLLPTLALLFVLGWSLAVLAGFAHAYFPDTQHLAEVGLQVLLFLTPVMYPASMLERNGLGFLLHYNPLAVLLEMLRGALLYAQVPPATTYAAAALLISVPAACAAWVIARLEHRVIFVL